MEAEVASIRAEVEDIRRRALLAKEAYSLRKELDSIKKEIEVVKQKVQNAEQDKSKEEQARKEKEERERKEREKKERKEKEEREKKEKAEADKKAKEEADKKAKEEAEKKAKEEKEKKEKEEAEKKAKEAQSKSASAPAKTTTTSTATPVKSSTTTTPVKTTTASTPVKTTTTTATPSKQTTTAAPAKTTTPVTTTAPAKTTTATPTSSKVDEERKKQKELESQAVLNAKNKIPETQVNKANATYSPEVEKQVREWIEAVTGEKLGSSLGESLKSGVILCNLINKLKPDTIKKINKQKMPFMMMENIQSFITAAGVLGVPSHDMFQTVDLFEEKNMNQVVVGLLALGRQSQRIPGYTGATIGPKMSDKHEVQFTDEQLKRGLNELNFAQKSQAESQKTVSEFRKPGMDNIVKSQSTGTTTASLPLMDKDKSAVQKEVSAASLQRHNIIK